MPTPYRLPPPGAGAFTVVTLNLRFGLARDGENAWAHRRPLFAGFFRDCPADFYAMQEVNGFQADELGPLLPAYGCVGRRRAAPEFWQHNIVWHRADWRCTEREHFYLSPTPDVPSRSRDSRWPRQCNLGVFERDGRRVAVASTHFDFAAHVQEASARIILRRLDRLSPDMAVVLAGDFNAPPASAAHRVFTSPGACPQDCAGALADAFTPPHPATHHGFSGRRDGDHIDWILFRGPIGRRSSGVFQNPMAGRYLSDHYPVWTVFDWSPER